MKCTKLIQHVFSMCVKCIQNNLTCNRRAIQDGSDGKGPRVLKVPDEEASAVAIKAKNC